MVGKVVLLTGVTGFIGSALVTRLATESRWQVVASLRGQKMPSVPGVKVMPMGEVGPHTDWSMVLEGLDTVVHTAAVAHVRNGGEENQLSRLRQVNVYGALTLARQAAAAGVKRFVFISSIGVNGNINVRPFTALDVPHPVDPYAQSKWEAEQGLWRIQQETGMELVIIRPPLVYGPEAPGNFGSLVRWIGKGIPLPLGAIHNRRSLVGIDNLVDLIVRCIDHPAAANQVFLAGDGRDLSTTELLRLVGDAMGRPARLIPVPAGVLKLSAALLGRKAMAQRLLGSLQVDISQTCETLDWQPPFTVEEGLRRCFLSSD
ncbi:Nucleoside-diphosphate-sugar epimerase [Pseudomonas sihuiensis]|uniref:Nucleoside-diphosphate-sugar epimerase n=1 Tax=Pseudomonas sihuiensis TaxID=1274359 RepID=A0A1H2L9J8_9PSED|nr:SDR family oxidoreductase [Pseudomonas sihuiensis]SDU77502.1 Nucleoside-diphosphate-sugar epimerase [Pseudomonas sihuiensis]